MLRFYRHLSGEIASEWESLADDDPKKVELMKEAHLIVPYHMQHNAEAEACDLLMEMEHLELFTDKGKILSSFHSNKHIACTENTNTKDHN